MPLSPWALLGWMLRATYALISNLLGFYLVESARAVPNFALAVTVAILVVVGAVTMLFGRWQLALALTMPFGRYYSVLRNTRSTDDWCCLRFPWFYSCSLRGSTGQDGC